MNLKTKSFIGTHTVLNTYSPIRTGLDAHKRRLLYRLPLWILGRRKSWTNEHNFCVLCASSEFGMECDTRLSACMACVCALCAPSMCTGLCVVSMCVCVCDFPKSKKKKQSSKVVNAHYLLHFEHSKQTVDKQ